MTNEIPSVAALGFQAGAEAYERGRPEYPAAAVHRLIQELQLSPDKIVAELGAGTGKFTKLLVAQMSAKIVAIEPVEGMRRKFSEILPKVELLIGTAEKIPLASLSLDAVIVAQAFHWFEGVKALKEIHRVLRPGGWLGLIWNVRDETHEWMGKLTEIIDRYESGAPRYKSGLWKAAFQESSLFTSLQSAQIDHSHFGTPEMVVNRVASISFISALPEDKKSEVLDEVKCLLSASFETKGRDRIAFPYQTHIFWCRKKEIGRDRNR